MKVKVYENRHLEITQELGTQNENNIEKMELEVPEKYQDWVKEIVFITDNGTVWDLIDNDTYIFKKNITKYEKIKFYIRLVKGEDDFRSIEEDLYFNENHEIEGEVTPEEQSDIERAMATIESGLARVTEKEDELVDLIDDVQTKLDNGEFDGKDGKDGADGQPGADGKDGIDGKDGVDGISPTIAETQTASGYDISITDKNGTKTISLVNGKDGVNGQDGKDGAKGEKRRSWSKRRTRQSR